VTRLHSISALVLLGAVGGLIAVARAANEPELFRKGVAVAALVLTQGAVGYWQYFTGVPVLLVAVHITLASLTWITIVRLDLSVDTVGLPAKVRERVP
jgi:cytochrome c oxidase assembly protein subunit 15